MLLSGLRSAQATAGDLLLHLGNRHDLETVILSAVNNSVAAFMHFPEAGLGELMDGMTCGRYFRSAFDTCDQAFDLEIGIMLGITDDEIMDGP